jgi:hypothetical protein
MKQKSSNDAHEAGLSVVRLLPQERYSTSVCLILSMDV